MSKSLKLTVQYVVTQSSTLVLPLRTQFRRWVRSALEQEAEIVIRIVDSVEGCDLNRRFRGKDYATNVLTFVYDDISPVHGDIVLCAPVIDHEAQQQQKPLMAHYAHMIIHGVLHLQGYDHIEEDDALLMESREVAILARMGISNPYLSLCNATANNA